MLNKKAKSKLRELMPALTCYVTGSRNLSCNIFSRTYIIPPAIIAGVVAGSAMWLLFIAVYKLLLKRLRPRRQQREATGGGSVEVAEEATNNNNDGLMQIATIPRARLANSSKTAAGTQFNRKYLK